MTDEHSYLWDLIHQGVASEEQKLDAIYESVENVDVDRIDEIAALLSDISEVVRYFALQALVIDLKQERYPSESKCWDMLGTDESEDVRAMCATCIGSIHEGDNDSFIIDKLFNILRDNNTSMHVKKSVYIALLHVAGRTPSDWLDSSSQDRKLEVKEIDWALLEEVVKKSGNRQGDKESGLTQ